MLQQIRRFDRLARLGDVTILHRKITVDIYGHLIPVPMFAL